MQVCFFIDCLSFKPDTENNVNFDAVSSKRANFDELQFLADRTYYGRAIGTVLRPSVVCNVVYCG